MDVSAVVGVAPSLTAAIRARLTDEEGSCNHVKGTNNAWRKLAKAAAHLSALATDSRLWATQVVCVELNWVARFAERPEEAPCRPASAADARDLAAVVPALQLLAMTLVASQDGGMRWLAKVAKSVHADTLAAWLATACRSVGVDAAAVLNAELDRAVPGTPPMFEPGMARAVTWDMAWELGRVWAASTAPVPPWLVLAWLQHWRWAPAHGLRTLVASGPTVDDISPVLRTCALLQEFPHVRPPCAPAALRAQWADAVQQWLTITGGFVENLRNKGLLGSASLVEGRAAALAVAVE